MASYYSQLSDKEKQLYLMKLLGGLGQGLLGAKSNKFGPSLAQGLLGAAGGGLAARESINDLREKERKNKIENYGIRQELDIQNQRRSILGLPPLQYPDFLGTSPVAQQSSQSVAQPTQPNSAPATAANGQSPVSGVPTATQSLYDKARMFQQGSYQPVSRNEAVGMAGVLAELGFDKAAAQLYKWEPNVTTWTATQVEAAGYPAGTTVQEDPNGKLNIKYPYTVPSGKYKDEQFVTPDNQLITKVFDTTNKTTVWLNAAGQQISAPTDISALRSVKDTTAKPSTTESTSATYATRMETSNKTLNSLADGGYNRADFWSSVEANVAEYPGGNYFASPEGQRQIQAERDFTNAILRQESGAAISQSEFDNAAKQYFPRFGDSPEVLAQKARNRQLAIEGMRNSSGNAYDQLQRQRSFIKNGDSGSTENKDTPKAETKTESKPEAETSNVTVPGYDVPVNKMSLQQLQAIGSGDTSKLTPAQLQALAERWEELNK